MAVGRWLLKMGPKGIFIYCGSAKMEGSWRRGSVVGICAKGIQPTASVQSSTVGLPKIPALHMVELTGGQQDNQRQSIPLDPVHEGNMTDKEMVPSQARGPGMKEMGTAKVHCNCYFFEGSTPMVGAASDPYT